MLWWLLIMVCSIYDLMLSRYVEPFQKLSTPFYFYDMELLQRALHAAQASARRHDFMLHYALKANPNHRVLTTIRNHEFGADCVSGNEVIRALETGFAPQHIVFAGVGKRDNEIEHALRHNIFCFNC